MKKINGILLSFLFFLTLLSAISLLPNRVVASESTGIVIPENTGLPDPAGGISAIIANFLNWLLTQFLILALIAFVITGVQYLLATGNSRGDTLERAKNNFKYAIIAVAIVGAGFIILIAIDNFLSASTTI